MICRLSLDFPIQPLTFHELVRVRQGATKALCEVPVMIDHSLATFNDRSIIGHL